MIKKRVIAGQWILIKKQNRVCYYAEMINIIKEKSQEILEVIKESKNILLHLHPKPDPDSIGSALALKFALESLNKKVTVIEGDTPLDESFSFLPGYQDVVNKNYFEIDLSEIDLFIILDSGSKQMISREGEIIFPKNLKTIVIDHHKTNQKYGDINLVDVDSSATAELLFKIFKEWGIEITKNIAANLYIGIWGDTGSFSYSNTTSQTMKIISELIEIYPDFNQLIKNINLNLPKGKVLFDALALNSIESFFNDTVALTTVSFQQLKEKGIGSNDMGASVISNILISVKQWRIGVSLTEKEPGKIGISFRSKDGTDVSKIAEELGGGGHAVAAGALLECSLEEAKNKVLETLNKYI